MIQKRFQIVYAEKCVLNNFTVVMSNVKNYKLGFRVSFKSL